MTDVPLTAVGGDAIARTSVPPNSGDRADEVII
jgi:hypothetical protein